MCGIAGVFASSERVARAALPIIVSAQRHRGPDDAGEAYLSVPAGTLGLGHRRLSILDLSPLGHQPMEHAGSGDVLVYNGEVYNFRALRGELERLGCTFRSDSDTEVVLAALVTWGTSAFARFQGMYALAWYRKREQRLVLARDPVGIKPLYYASTESEGGRALLFASEVRPMMASGMVSRAISPQGVAGVLAYGAVQEPFTFFRDVHPFPAGHFAEISVADPIPPGPLASRAFWSLPAVSDRPMSPNDALEATRATLSAAVRDHLVSDVPVGVFLSSGVDSTIVAGLAARYAPGIESFTIAFGDNPDMSEGAIAGNTARRFGIPHHDIQITNAVSLEGAEAWLRAQDQPSMDGLNVYLVSRAVRERGITVALSGQGGDEVFGGYPSFAEVPRMMRAVRAMRFLPRSLRSAAAQAIGFRRPAASRQKFADMLLTDGTAARLTLARRRVLASAHMRALGLEPRALGLGDAFQRAGLVDSMPMSNADPVHAISLTETRFYMGNMLLRDCDANGMAHSLEIRVPMLDQRVLDTFLPMPGHIRLPNGGCDKHLLRAGFPELFAPEMLNQPKSGFILPIKRWMTGPMRAMCEGALSDLKGTGIVAPAGVDLVWRGFLREPESVMWSRAWTLVVLGVYVRQLGVQADAEHDAARAAAIDEQEPVFVGG